MILTHNSVRIVLVTALILLIPLVAMQFTDEVQWTLFDFVVAAVLLLSAGFAYEFLRKKFGPRYRIMIGVGVLAVLLFIWAQLAVGII